MIERGSPYANLVGHLSLAMFHESERLSGGSNWAYDPNIWVPAAQRVIDKAERLGWIPVTEKTLTGGKPEPMA